MSRNVVKIVIVMFLCCTWQQAFSQMSDIAITDVTGGSEELVNFRKVDEGENITFRVVSSTGDPVFAHNMPSGATYAANIFAWTPKDNQSGMYAIGFYSGQPQDMVYKNLRIVVANTLFRIPREEKFQYLFMATDPDDDDVKLTATGIPTGATFEGGEFGPKLFTWTPTKEQVGEHVVTITATDQPASGPPQTDVSRVIITVSKLKYESMPYDFDEDGKINFTDYAMFAKHWLKGIDPLPKPAVDPDTVVYHAPTSKVYHKEDCSYLANSETVESKTIKEALEDGMRPDTRCKPDDPTYDTYPKFDPALRNMTLEEVMELLTSGLNDPNSQ